MDKLKSEMETNLDKYNLEMNNECTYTSVNKSQKSNISTGSVVSNSVFYMYLHMVWMMLVFLAGIWIYVFSQNHRIFPEKEKKKNQQEIDISFKEGNSNMSNDDSKLTQKNSPFISRSFVPVADDGHSAVVDRCGHQSHERPVV